MSTDNKPGSGLLVRLWTTKGCRFAARERLLKTNWLSITSISALSGYVIVVALTLLAFGEQLDSINEKWLNVISIGLSVLIIAFSLIEFSRDHLGVAEKLNHSALRVGELYGQLTAKMDTGQPTADELQSLERQYAEILSDARLNHTHADYMMFMLMNYHEFPRWWTANGFVRSVSYMTLLVRSYWIYIAAIVTFPILAAMFGGHLLALETHP